MYDLHNNNIILKYKLPLNLSMDTTFFILYIMFYQS